MTNLGYYWIFEAAFFGAGILCVCRKERRERFPLRIFFSVLLFLFILLVVNRFLLTGSTGYRLLYLLAGFGFLVFFQLFCWKISWTVSIYFSMWVYMIWELLREVLYASRVAGFRFFELYTFLSYVETILLFAVGLTILFFTVAKWMPDGTAEKLGPRQFSSALLLFGIFSMLSFNVGSLRVNPERWIIFFLSQLLLVVVLYLQNELFKKSAMRQELAMMNMLRKKEQEQYELSRENIALISQQSHDLKHLARAIRDADREELGKYLEEIEESTRIYDAIVKTGNEVLDTILTEKSLYCRERGIEMSCVADGNQTTFINTVDLYAILGNVIDNAIEAVEKLTQPDRRQIDVLIYREQKFLVMNITNPTEGRVAMNGELPASTKEDKWHHGFGLKSVRYLVKKYNGAMTIRAEEQFFSLRILIPIEEGDIKAGEVVTS